MAIASSETDAALALAGLSIRAAGLSAEANAAFSLGSARPAGMGAEADSARAPGGTPGARVTIVFLQ